MEAIDFDGVTVRIAESQEEYQTLPAKQCSNGAMMFAFKLDKEEIKEINKTGVIFWQQFVGSNDMQPIAMSTLRNRLSE